MKWRLTDLHTAAPGSQHKYLFRKGDINYFHLLWDVQGFCLAAHKNHCIREKLVKSRKCWEHDVVIDCGTNIVKFCKVWIKICLWINSSAKWVELYAWWITGFKKKTYQRKLNLAKKYKTFTILVPIKSVLYVYVQFLYKNVFTFFDGQKNRRYNYMKVTSKFKTISSENSIDILTKTETR